MIERIRLPFKKEMPVIGIRIIDSEYAKSFVNKGIIHFSNPSEWRNKERKSGHRLDEMEGCFCFSQTSNDDMFIKINRPFYREIFNGMHRYYEDFQNLAACCFYGINLSRFSETKIKYGVKEVIGYNTTVSLSYFREFEKPNSVEKKVILIFDLPSFINRLTEALINMGCSREEIIAFPVYYQNKNVPFYVSEPFPFSYFIKDDSFSEQSELRILICSKNKDFWNSFKSKNLNVTIGDISKIARIEDYYEDNLYFSIQGKELIYSLSHPFTEWIENSPFTELVGLLYQTLQNQLPGEPLSQSEIDKRVKMLSRILQGKHGVLFCTDWRLEGVSSEQASQLPELLRGMIRDKA